jgi:hypothetical protein
MKLNLLIAWVLVLLGFLGGAVAGLQFDKEHWLGGYSSWKRRLLRLGHISFFGLAFINLIFYLTTTELTPNTALSLASYGFVAGGFSMPACCSLAAFFPRTKVLFAVPVTSLLFGAAMTLLEVTKL